MVLYSNIIGKGTPLLILHGFLGMGDNWNTLGKLFSETYEVHLIDQRNHGRSFHSKELSYGLLTEDVRLYCEHHQITRCVLLGHSMGGKTAMNFAFHYPDITEKLIVADIAPRYYSPHHQTILAALSALDFSVIKTRDHANQVLEGFIDDAGIRQFLAKNIYWKTKDELGLRINLSALIENIDELGAALDENAVFEGKTLFLKGSRSKYILPEDEPLIRKHFPNAVVKTISKSGHWLHAENPKEFYRVVMEFLSL